MFSPNRFYHIYNHANGFEDLFKNQDNYRYFLQQWNKYVSPIAESHAYCLMPNHIHFLIKIRSEAEIRSNFGLEVGGSTFGKFQTFQKFVSKQFANLFSSYTQAFNKMFSRRGSLFMPNFKRKEIDNEDYLLSLVYYIHLNPVHHKFRTDFRDWKHSSYHALVSDTPTFLNKDFIAKYFDDIENFKLSHEKELIVEDEYLLE
jgi:REP element-mobilizing transposase RayT